MSCWWVWLGWLGVVEFNEYKKLCVANKIHLKFEMVGLLTFKLNVIVVAAGGKFVLCGVIAT